jgi:hypothetical protein
MEFNQRREGNISYSISVSKMSILASNERVIFILCGKFEETQKCKFASGI